MTARICELFVTAYTLPTFSLSLFLSLYLVHATLALILALGVDRENQFSLTTLSSNEPFHADSRRNDLDDVRPT